MKLKVIEFKDVPKWTEEEDLLLSQSLLELGIPRTYVPLTFQLSDPHSKFSDCSWGQIAQRVKKPGYLCCYRFYGPMQGKLLKIEVPSDEKPIFPEIQLPEDSDHPTLF
ncbi:hypothetical protein HMI54_004891 [Coelomomyces lativittatus]|nr:hypothetical protein HMI56_003830 [Coelomomyces lativittatus]KAJ1506640.1 hypothetical protein HMI54_004891 [Coelomomyces lativittatus]KAJ1514444.1 hypothetical protein HMI55_004662 [Coelomomyces lativittatus]